MDDKKIARLLDRRPEEGLRQLTAKYRGLVGMIASRVLAFAPDDVEECIADTFIAVWKKRAELDCERGSMKGFIACVARNTAINRWRKLSRERTIPIDDLELADALDVAAELEQKETLATVQRLISELDEPTRSVLILKLYLFQTNGEIAERLELNKKQVENYLYQGKKRLRAALEAENER